MMVTVFIYKRVHEFRYVHTTVSVLWDNTVEHGGNYSLCVKRLLMSQHHLQYLSQNWYSNVPGGPGNFPLNMETFLQHHIPQMQTFLWLRTDYSSSV